MDNTNIGGQKRNPATMCMRLGRGEGRIQVKLTVVKFLLEVVESFKYLGCSINKQNQKRPETVQTIQTSVERLINITYI